MAVDAISIRSNVFNKLTQVSSPSALPPIFTLLPNEQGKTAINYPDTFQDAKLNQNWLHITKLFNNNVSQVNYIYNADIKVDQNDSNINRITSNDSLYLDQLYVPPNYFVHFYKTNPVENKSITAPDLTLSPNTTVSDASTLTLTSGEQLINSNTVKSINAPFIIVYQSETLYDMVFNACTKNQQYFVGPDKSISEVYVAGQTTCDKFMNFHCSSNAHENDDVCRCFQRQKLLDFQYGKDLSISVQCFDKVCLESNTAYKTNTMRLADDCSLAICEKVVKTSKVLQNIKNDNIVCAKDTKATNLPPLPKKTNSSNEQSNGNNQYNNASSNTPPKSTTRTTDTEYPWYAWLFLGLTIVMFITVFILFFVRRKKMLG